MSTSPPTITGLFRVETLRASSRRVVRGLLLITLGLSVLAGVLTYLLADDPPNLVEFWEGTEEGEALIAVPGTLLLIASILIGGSLIGAEWKFGTITTTLTWEPRRVRLILVRLVAYAAVMFVVALLVVAIFVVAMLPVTLIRGSTAGADAEWYRECLYAVLRIAALAAIATWVAGAITVVAPSTSSAMVGVTVYILVAESLLRGWFPGQQEWLLSNNLLGFLFGTTTDEFEHNATEAFFTLLGYTGVLTAIAAVWFSRRDIAGAS